MSYKYVAHVTIPPNSSPSKRKISFPVESETLDLLLEGICYTVQELTESEYIPSGLSIHISNVKKDQPKC